MNTSKILSLVTSLALIFTLGGCDDYFEELNTNPNEPTATDPDYVFNYVIKEGAGEYGYVFSYNQTYLLQWVMQTATPWGNSTMPPYSMFHQTYIQNLWEYYYTNLLLNTVVLENLTATDPNDLNKYQIARIWKVYAFHRVTDLWGDVPYTEAFNAFGEGEEPNMKPAYDRQEVIYKDMIATLKDAVSKINPALPFYDVDLLYNKDLNKWIRFANSLCLRLAIRSADQTTVQQLMQENNFISSHEESALFAYPESDQSWWYPLYETNRTSPTAVAKISELMVLKMLENNDPRRKIFADPPLTKPDTIIGVPNLLANTTVNEPMAIKIGVANTSYIGSFFTQSPGYKNPILTYAEVCFLKAEAALKGWGASNAETFYNEGIRASMKQYGVDTANIESFLSGNAKFNGSLEQIITQKWIALYLNGYETFAEYRRTGYPQLKKYNLVIEGTKLISKEWVDVPQDYVPGRLPYPQTEAGLNPEKYQEAIDRMGGEDTYYQPVWFMTIQKK